ncbi:hypothetical protein, variant [Aphanomyces invadans]|uniref:Uncharacterized protein n=1 Tax=Aphanomyces invadans TaxID=157072 RepID=A0A024UJM5_9STRA|nr:hypothetical protein, variant [Aphanomyces invadans]ETW06651.1 hypothetical protein, variant [Aphanomyces invadans]|eukprot:XP_008864726.1 hypothetical protein, variant [Aphanomyces invadans]
MEEGGHRDGDAAADEHPWLLHDDFAASHRILKQCMDLSDAIHPTSKAHVDITRKATRVVASLKTVYNNHANGASSAADSSRDMLQVHTRDVVEILTDAWVLLPTIVLKHILGDIVELYTDILMSKADIDNITDVECFLRSVDGFLSANPLKHAVRKLEKCKGKLQRFQVAVHDDQAKLNRPRWTIVGDRVNATAITRDVQEYFETHRITPADEQHRLAIVKRLEHAITRNKEWRDASIELYGSSLSTMGTQGCDMDLCLSWKTSTSVFSLSNSAAIGKARHAHELALQNRSNHEMGLDLLDRVKADLAKHTAVLGQLVLACGNAPADEKLAKKKTCAQFFVRALLEFTQVLERLEPTAKSPADMASHVRIAAHELKVAMADNMKRTKQLHRLTAVLQREGCTVHNVLAHARVPIIKFSHVKSQLDCDLCMGNTLATRNTRLLRAYGQYDRRVSPLVLAVKKWAKARGVNDASQNTLSSYSYAIVVIHFLQTVGILPNLQDPALCGQLGVAREIVHGVDVSFCADSTACRTIAPRQERRDAELDVGELLVLFFDYVTAFPWLSRVVSIRGRDQTKRDRWTSAAKTWRMSIEDPFETSRDLGIVLTPLGQECVLREFARAKNVLLETGSFAALTAVPPQPAPGTKANAGSNKTCDGGKPSKAIIGRNKNGRNTGAADGASPADTPPAIPLSGTASKEDAGAAPGDSVCAFDPAVQGTVQTKTKKQRGNQRNSAEGPAPSAAVSPIAPTHVEGGRAARGEPPATLDHEPSMAGGPAKENDAAPTSRKHEKSKRAVVMSAREDRVARDAAAPTSQPASMDSAQHHGQQQSPPRRRSANDTPRQDEKAVPRCSQKEKKPAEQHNKKGCQEGPKGKQHQSKTRGHKSASGSSTPPAAPVVAVLSLPLPAPIQANPQRQAVEEDAGATTTAAATTSRRSRRHGNGRHASRPTAASPTESS